MHRLDEDPEYNHLVETRDYYMMLKAIGQQNLFGYDDYIDNNIQAYNKLIQEYILSNL